MAVPTKTPAEGTGDDGGRTLLKEMVQQQMEQQKRLRHVQQFLASPMFFDLQDLPVTVSDDPDALEERKRDLDYRIHVLESLMVLLKQERTFLDRVRSAAETGGGGGNGEGSGGGEGGGSDGGAASGDADLAHRARAGGQAGG